MSFAFLSKECMQIWPVPTFSHVKSSSLGTATTSIGQIKSNFELNKLNWKHIMALGDFNSPCCWLLKQCSTSRLCINLNMLHHLKYKKLFVIGDRHLTTNVLKPQSGHLIYGAACEFALGMQDVLPRLYLILYVYLFVSCQSRWEKARKFLTYTQSICRDVVSGPGYCVGWLPLWHRTRDEINNCCEWRVGSYCSDAKRIWNFWRRFFLLVELRFYQCLYYGNFFGPFLNIYLLQK